MDGKIPTLVSALKVFLKSLPINGVKFNICSFGSNHTFLFKKSKTYDQSSLDEALRHVNTFSANYGGTEMFPPVKETCKNRYKDMPLEVMILTDGQIWNQQVSSPKFARFDDSHRPFLHTVMNMAAFLRPQLPDFRKFPIWLTLL